MSRANITQKQCGLHLGNKQLSGFSLEETNFDPTSIIITMLKIIKTNSSNSMDEATKTQFSKIADAVIRITEEIKE